MATLTDEQRALLTRPILGWAGTHRPDGSIHSTIVWVDVDGDDVVFNTAVGRAKERYLRADSRVSVSVVNPEDGFHYISVSGTAQLELEGADATIDRLAKKYLGVDSYPFRTPEEQRITVRITPETIIWASGAA